MSLPSVSAVVVNWNGLRWLDRCLGSLLDQTYEALEIVLVDNASSDGSCAYVCKTYPQVRLVANSVNMGFAAGNEAGIGAASGQLILMLNTDAWLKREAVEQLVDAYLSSGDDVVAPVEVAYDEARDDLRDDARSCLTIDLLGHPVWRTPTEDDAAPFYLSGACLLFSKQLYADTGGLDADFFMYFEETDWFWRLRLYGKKFRTVRTVRVYHAGHGSAGEDGTIQYRRFLWRNQNAPQMLLKNYSALNLTWCVPLYLLQNLVEIAAFAAIRRFDICRSYVEGWRFNIQALRRTLKKRAVVQQRRVVSDWELMKLMYWGPGKLAHFFRRFARRDV